MAANSPVPRPMRIAALHPLCPSFWIAVSEALYRVEHALIRVCCYDNGRRQSKVSNAAVPCVWIGQQGLIEAQRK